jgi:hypothetical protein
MVSWDTRMLSSSGYWAFNHPEICCGDQSRISLLATMFRNFRLQKLAEDLRDRGKLDLSESFIDASFSGAKKGALVSALQSAAKAAKSWQSQTAMVFLSPCTWPALRLMKQNSSKLHSSNDSSGKLPGE